jgi:hypothetical protein
LAKSIVRTARIALKKSKDLVEKSLNLFQKTLDLFSTSRREIFRPLFQGKIKSDLQHKKSHPLHSIADAIFVLSERLFSALRMAFRLCR